MKCPMCGEEVGLLDSTWCRLCEEALDSINFIDYINRRLNS